MGYSCYRLFKFQKRVVTMVTLSKHNVHTDTLFTLNKLLKIEDIFEIQCLKFYYKYIEMQPCQNILLTGILNIVMFIIITLDKLLIYTMM